MIQHFTLPPFSDHVPVLLINSEKRVSHPTFEENTERFLCSLFSVTWGHDPFSMSLITLQKTAHLTHI